MPELTPIVEQELRAAWLGVPHRFQLLDFLGVAFGLYMIYDGVTDRGPNWLTIALGGVAIYIHSQRFFYAPQTREGLVRLLRELNVTPEEIAGQLGGGVTINA